MNKKLAALSALALSAVAAVAQTTPVDYGAKITENLETINGVWATVAGLVIGIGLVTVGVRFFKKVK